MDANIVTMIADAAAVLDHDPLTTSARLTVDPVNFGEPSKYRGNFIQQLDMLGLCLPVVGADCKFRLVIVRHTHWNATPVYAVTQDGQLCLAQQIGDCLCLSVLDCQTTDELCELIQQARTLLVTSFQ